MQCVCGLAWDVNDPDPPECRKRATGNAAIVAIRRELGETVARPLVLYAGG